MPSWFRVLEWQKNKNLSAAVTESNNTDERLDSSVYN